MTRDQITTLVTGTVGMLDATSVSICNDFVQRAYEMVWNAELWRDTVTIDATPTVAQGTNTFNLPANYDRIISLQLLSSGIPVGYLDPTTSTFILQTEPTALTVQGIPTKYEEFVHTDGVRKIRLFPVPNAAYTLTLSGKRTCPTLGASDSLQIRNVDNAVIALATADMYTRMRQLGKAAEMAKKAGAFIEEARGIENRQSNQPRMAKNLNVASNSLAAMTYAVRARTGQWGLDDVILIQDFLRRNYQTIWDMCNWSESTVMANVSSDGSEVILPVFFDRIISIRADVNLGQLSVVQPQLYFGICPNIFEQTGTAITNFSYLTSVGVGILPPTREKLAIKSSSANDKAKVFVMGESAGTEVSETVVLNGTTEVNTVNDYDTPLTVAKDVTAGDVRIRAYTSNVVLETILAAELERKHMRLWIQPTPTATQTCLVLGKRTIKPLVQDEDTPLLRDIQGALIAATCADMFAKAGNDKASADARAQASAALDTLVKLETQQGAFSASVVPEVEYSGYYDDWLGDSWMVAKA